MQIEKNKDCIAQICKAPLIYKLDDIIDEIKIVKDENIDELHCHEQILIPNQ